jgi:aspartate/methionine/tyrosine aminotransferase
MDSFHFSTRTAWEFHENPLTRIVHRLRDEGRAIHDWTIANPTVCGFPYDRHRMSAALGSDASFVYAPDPMGAGSARAAVSRFLALANINAPPERILLTASSSEAYTYLFRLICGPGDSIAIPKPGYPLFDDLSRLSDVTVNSYRYHYAGGWHLDETSLRDAITPSTRAIVVIHPNNPTGNYLSREEQDIVAQCASEHNLAVIADEVFLTFPFARSTHPVSCAHMQAPLVFVLNGLSKAAGLPQMKLGWISVHGEEQPVLQALQRLEMIADTYLSVNTPVQSALPLILETSGGTGEAIRSRVAANYALLNSLVNGSLVSELQAEAGWNAILRLPGIMSDESWATELLTRAGLLVHPGHFFDLELQTSIVVSLLPEESLVRTYAEMLLRIVEGGRAQGPDSFRRQGTLP